jgi:putative sugar O-methyltransferase
MILSGNKAIQHLAGVIEKEDPAASSHWRKYHTGFTFTGDDFSGIQGFGNLEHPYTGWRAVAHHWLQQRYRRMAASFPAFAELDALNKAITKKQNRSYDLDVLRQTLTLAFLRKQIPDAFHENATAWVIGDGFASMSCLLFASRSVNTIVLINLSKTLMVDLWYLRRWMGEEVFAQSVHLITDVSDVNALSASDSTAKYPRVIAIQAMDHDLLNHLPADLVINIASMQEMDLSVIAGYFNNIHTAAARYQPLYFYCCNREEKLLPDGTITRIDAYPWEAGDAILVNERCPWHQQYYLLKPPFYFPYDGPIRHQLRKMLSDKG